MRLTVIFIPGNDTSETDSISGLAFQLLGDLSAEEQHWIAWPLQTRTRLHQNPGKVSLCA